LILNHYNHGNIDTVCLLLICKIYLNDIHNSVALYFIVISIDYNYLISRLELYQ